MNLSLIGMGNVGQELVRQTIVYPQYSFVSVADTSCTVAKRGGFSSEEMEEILKLKEGGKKLEDYKNPDISFLADIEAPFRINKYKPDILVDLSTSQTYPILLNAIEHGLHVVGSNKVPYAEVSYDDYEILCETAKKKRKKIDNRTTVSANLGVLTRIREFARTAGGVNLIRGSPSGTMAYISWLINGNSKVPFSNALKEAKDKKYTEPHPRDDIVGEDSRRKGVIMSRTLGFPIEMSDIKVEKILPQELMSVSVDEFMKGIEKIDGRINRRVMEARNNDCVLRYIAELDFVNKNFEIGFKEIPVDDKITKSTGTDNSISIYPRRWNGKNITIEGPGAGVEVTAQGVLAGMDYIYELYQRT
jgi:homoserine dehydrogenase